MSDQTTGPGASGDAGTPDYKAKYDGLMAAFSKRQNEFAAREQAMESERADAAAKAARLAEFEAKEQAATEEAAAEAQYEALRTRFEQDPPTPLRHGEARGLAGSGGDDGSPDYLKRKLAKQAGVSLGSDAWPG